MAMHTDFQRAWAQGERIDQMDRATYAIVSGAYTQVYTTPWSGSKASGPGAQKHGKGPAKAAIGTWE